MDKGEVIIYQSADGQTELSVRLRDDSVWLSQAQIATLFDINRTSVLRHIKNIYQSEELDRNSTCAVFAQVRQEGKRSVHRWTPYQ